MSLKELWTTQRDYLTNKHVRQIIAISGDGILQDNNQTSIEFREFLAQLPIECLEQYAEQCLSPFDNSGLVLQDVINNIGERLGFDVTYGRYKGVKTKGTVGFDGLWKLPDGHNIVVEVKTTDAYRIDLNKLVGYRNELVQQDKFSELSCTFLIIVGRQDTGDLESQIRGSKYASDFRLISIEALLRLLHIKFELDNPRTAQQIHRILIPQDFIRLDGIIDILFLTAEEVYQESPTELASIEIEEEPVEISLSTINEIRERSISKLQNHLQLTIVRRSKSEYSSPDDPNLVIVCLVSKEYSHSSHNYWFGFRNYHYKALENTSNGLVTLACGGNRLLLVPFSDFVNWLPAMNTTDHGDRFHWHIRITEQNNAPLLLLKPDFERIDLTKYLI